MKKIFVSAFLLSFVISFGFVNDVLGETKNIDVDRKEQSINGRNYQHYIRKLDGDVISHFTFITVMHQDLLDELAMSFRSDFQPDIVGNLKKNIDKDDSGIAAPWDGKPQKMEDSDLNIK